MIVLPGGDGFGTGGDSGREQQPREFVANRLAFES